MSTEHGEETGELKKVVREPLVISVLPASKNIKTFIHICDNCKKQFRTTYRSKRYCDHCRKTNQNEQSTISPSVKITLATVSKEEYLAMCERSWLRNK